MKLTVEDGYIVADGGHIWAGHAVLEAIQVGVRVYVIYDYMDFPRQHPARNFFAHDLAGNTLWRVADIGGGAVDAYTHFISAQPLTVFNLAGCECIIDEANGQVLSTRFTR
ncbi:hypothetical protein PY254_01915 [Rhodanobacter sp. AS-Z3]|uniref:hypothetical protein n=1 Tax=Rhodanobacter sp. AS-Z3 TaxID=3031330 RepID=UPI002479A5C8|nr:hypothetical protein [Rhodanobacter sp. AS-Z3]WEN15457.1 hypothetical protein PY254_01915 [Rhodanobacter sp. AS-Z3]